MEGWSSGSESEDEPLNLKLFARKSFKFVGISQEMEDVLKKAIQQVGGSCDNEFALYTMTTSEYFNSSIEHEFREHLYNVTFIRDCVDANRFLNIDQYRLGQNCEEKKDYKDFDPCCYNFHNGLDSCIVCEPNIRTDIVVKQKKKFKNSGLQSDEIKSTSKKSKVGLLTSKSPIDEGMTNNVGNPKKIPWQPWERQMILDYIICNEMYFCAKSPNLYRRMISEGYLTHRTPEAMRYCYRTSIEHCLESYNLPKPILEKFKNPDRSLMHKVKKMTDHKKSTTERSFSKNS